MYYLFPNTYMYISERYFQKSLLSISIVSHDKLFGKKSIYAIERYFRGKCSSVQMLKGYMVTKRSGTLF